MTHSMMKGPYENHYYRLGSVIRNAVSQAQDTLCGIWKHQFCDGLRSARDYFEGLGAPGTREEKVGEIEFHDGSKIPMTVTKVRAKVQPVGPPKSLGELCIELRQELLPGFVIEYDDTVDWLNRDAVYILRNEIQELRRAMYHKHTSPEKERKTAKSERLIELVRNA